MEATLEAITFDELVGIQDMGAAGLTSSSSEMAAKGGSGLELHLDQCLHVNQVFHLMK